MKYMGRFKVVLIIAVVLSVMTLIVAASDVSVQRVNYSLLSNGKNVTDICQNPLISADDRVYVAIRDIGLIFNKNVDWNETNESISMNDMEKDNYCGISQYDTAETIAKAIVKEKYGDSIKENTKYDTCLVDADHIGAEPKYVVSVCFDASDSYDSDDIFNNASCRVYINAKTGAVNIEKIK